MSETISTYILSKLKTLDCNHIIGIPGTNCASFFDAIDATEGIDYIIPTSELEAGYIADGYARTGQISALCVAYGVGTLSLANPLAGAFAEKLPMILLNGGPTSEEEAIEKKLNTLFLHSTGVESSDFNLFKNITAYADIIKHPNEAKDKIDEAFRVALNKSQPVYLEIPSDFWHLPLDICASGDTVYFLAELHKLILNKIDENTVKYNTSEKFHYLNDLKDNFQSFFESTIFVIGPEIIRSGLSNYVLDFIKKYNINFLTTPLSKSFEGFFTPDYEFENYWGCVDNITFISDDKKNFIENAEIFICFGNIWGVDAKKFIIDNYSKMIDIGYGQARIGYKKFDNLDSTEKVFKEFVESLNFILDKPFENIQEIIKEERNKCVTNTNIVNALTQDQLNQEVQKFIQHEDSPELLFNVDACLAMFWGTEIRLKSGDEYLSNPAWLSIGHSAPASIGYFLKTKKIPFIVTGDGGFQMVSQTFSTMTKLKIPALIIVVNNSILGIEEFLLDPNSKRTTPFKYTEVKPWNYENFPNIYNTLSGENSQGYKAFTAQELFDILEEWSSGIKDGSIQHPWIINCLVKHDSLPSRLLKFKTQKSNSLLSAFKLR